MTPRKIIDAHRAIKEISGMCFPYKTARAVAALKRRLQEEADIVADAQRSLVEHYGGKAKGNQVTFADEETVLEFQNHYNDFMNEDTEVNLPTVDLSKHTNMFCLSPDTIDALDGIVIFEKEGTENG